MESETFNKSKKEPLSELKSKSIRGGVAVLGVQVASAVIQLISTVILARLLSKEDYGIMGMVVVITAFAGLFRDLGLSAAAIQAKDLTVGQQSVLFWLNVLFGAMLTVTVGALSPLVATFYQRPELVSVTIALSTTFLITSLGAQSNASLVKAMEFRRKGVATLAGALINLLMAITLSLRGYGYWALVWGQLAGAIGSTCLVITLSPFRPVLPKRPFGVRKLLKFGAHLTAFDFINYFHRNLDNILIGRFIGPDALGAYTRAYALIMQPLHATRAPIMSVAFPAMSKLQQVPAEFKEYYKRVTQYAALFSMPISAALYVNAVPLVTVLLGPKWVDSAALFQILSLVGFIQPSAGLRGLVALSLGDSKRYLRLGLLQASVTAIGFVIGIAWGAEGVAFSYVCSIYILLVPMLHIAFVRTPLIVRDYFTSVWRPALCSILAGIATLLCLQTLPSTSLPLVQVIVGMLSFVILFALTMILIPGGRPFIRRVEKDLRPIWSTCREKMGAGAVA